MRLKKYNKKRNFSVTDEPKGKLKKSKQKRFVIQFHRARRDHYDFRLEYKGVLVSFAIPKGFSFDSRDKRLAVRVEDHPLDYINFEGRIPKGEYGAGTVEIWDKGFYEISKDLDEGLKDGEFKVCLYGKKLVGCWAFVHFKDDNFLVIYENIDNKKVNEIKKDKVKQTLKLPFKTASVQLAVLSKKIPKGKIFGFEIKYDGYRALAFVENGKVKLVSRNGKDFTNRFKNIADLLQDSLQDKLLVLDGEIVVFDENGRSDFSLLQESLRKGENNFCYVVFDILALGEEDVRNKPLVDRKKLLNDLSKFFPKNIILSEFVESNGEECFEIANRLGLEGIMAKKKDSIYSGTRNDDWLKIKCFHRQEFVVGGYIGKNNNLASLLLGYYDNDKLIFIGKVGTGFNKDKKIEILNKLNKIEIAKSPFSNYDDKTCKFVKPKIVAEVQFAEITPSKLLRQASFIAFREDKDAKEIVLEEDN